MMCLPTRSVRAALVAALLGLFSATSAFATFHIINVSEVYTNGDGSVQFVELKALAAGQTELQHCRVVGYNADSTSSVLLFDFMTSFPALGADEYLLLATAAFQDSAGFAPDFVIPQNAFFPDGRIGFNRDPGELGAVVVDGVAYGLYTGANTGYGSPAAALPTDAAHSLKRVVFGIANRNNATDFRISANTPTRNDGTTTIMHPDFSGIEPMNLERDITLYPSRPNPARGSATFPFTLGRESSVLVSVYAADGSLVRTIAAGRLGPGPHQIRWDGRDADGEAAAAGIYLYRISTGEGSASRRMLLVK